MKKIIVLSIILLLISGCSTTDKQLSAEDYLLQVIENHINASSMTVEGDAVVNLGQDGVGLPVPIFATVMLDNKGNKVGSDDEAYTEVSLSLLLVSLKVEGWYKDGKIYYKYGNENNTFNVPAYEYKEIDPDRLLEIILNNCENIKMDSKSSGIDFTITPKDDLLDKILNELNIISLPTINSIDLNTLLKSIKLNDVVISVDKKGYMSRIVAGGEFAFKNYMVNGQIELKIKDINKTYIPKLNVSEF